MIPAKTIEVLGSSTFNSTIVKKQYDYAIDGNNLVELEILARRLSIGVKLDPNEARDWGNRLHLMVDSAVILENIP